VAPRVFTYAPLQRRARPGFSPGSLFSQIGLSPAQAPALDPYSVVLTDYHGKRSRLFRVLADLRDQKCGGTFA